ncbi:hypothetical protein BpHYR1_004390 [Brachionus plicatilis]|uniref:Uncharacterized protein n=1 Tax=Brachionus plicatilis TaxID=10195 RepID=A0A3M7PAY3_BRAPC|nr:hypothetical protein BpHYR1_004390 [Brachionus plicatilis]
MSDFNDIFGYKVYKPPPEKNIPMIQDLNVAGEVITLIDPSADVIQDPAVQKIFQSLDGERTVKIEDLPPDVRYDGWNKKAQYDNQVIVRGSGSRQNLQPRLPVVESSLLKDDGNSEKYHQEALRQAQLTAQNTKNSELEFSKQLQETKIALEKEIHRQLVEQLTLRAQKKSVTPEQQALIEKLYLDLRLINPELAFATLKASATLSQAPQQPPVQQIQRAPQVQQQEHYTERSAASHSTRHSEKTSRREEYHRDHYSSKHASSKPESRRSEAHQLVHNQGSIINARDEPIRIRVPKCSTKTSKSSRK